MGKGWRDDFLVSCVRKDILRGYWKQYKPMFLLKKAMMVEDFINRNQNDSVKIGFAKFLAYSLAISLFSLLKILLLYKHYKL